jgi:hypothetical protein
VGLLDRYPEADLAFGHRTFAVEDEESRRSLGSFFEGSYPAILDAFYERLGEVVAPDEMLEHACRHTFEINLIGEPTFVIMRRKARALDAGFDPSFSQMIDWELFTRFFVDRPLLHCREVLGTFRIHAGSASLANAPLWKHYGEFDRLLTIVLERFDGRLTPVQTEALQTRQLEARRLSETLKA